VSSFNQASSRQATKKTEGLPPNFRPARITGSEAACNFAPLPNGGLSGKRGASRRSGRSRSYRNDADAEREENARFRVNFENRAIRREVAERFFHVLIDLEEFLLKS